VSPGPVRPGTARPGTARPEPADELHAALRAWVGRPTGEPSVARDPVNQPMIRHWCDAMGDDNPIYTDAEAASRAGHDGVVAPPTMLQAWNMAGLRRRSAMGGQDELMALLDGAGYTSVVATNCEQEYFRYLRPGDLLTEEGVIEAVSPLKQTALGAGYFVTTLRTYRDQGGEPVATMRFRVLKFRPAAPGGAATPAVPRPAVSRDTAFFWEGTRAGELRIQRCAGCATLRHPPGPACPACGSFDWDFVVSAGRGRIYSFVVHHHPPVPPWTTPFVVVLVELDEGTRIVGNLLDADPAGVEIGQAVRVRFVASGDDLVLPQWEREP
jgi:uncharacterized OB-fold protein/acyl dehydratase